MKTILLFRTSFSPRNRLEYQTLFEFASRNSWRIQSIEYMNAAVSLYWKDNPAPRPDVRGIIELWNPDGCIVECGGIPDEPWIHEFSGIPVVFLDRPSARSIKSDRSTVISSDSAAIANMAAKELLSLGFDNFAYAEANNNLPWNVERGQYFCRTIRKHGKRVQSFTVPATQTPSGRPESLAGTLHSLPRPCGIFAANDATAATLINECNRIRIDIPGDMAVISVDNDVEICEHLPVTLTSIEQDFTNLGLVAAKALNDIMSSKPVPATISFGVKRVVHRLSTLSAVRMDRRVAVASEFIRSHFAQGIVPADIAKTMNICERQANRLFKKWRGHSLLDELHLQRLANAKDLLGNPKNQISTVAEVCGYSSASDFGRVFKRYFGITPRAWQRQRGI